MIKTSIVIFSSIAFSFILIGAIFTCAIPQNQRICTHALYEQRLVDICKQASNSVLHQFELNLIFKELGETSFNTDYMKYNSNSNGVQSSKSPGVLWIPSHLAASAPRSLASRTCYLLENMNENNKRAHVAEQIFISFVRTGSGFHWLRRLGANFKNLNLPGVTLRTPFEREGSYGLDIQYYSPDLSGLYLSGSNFHSSDLSGCNLYGSELSRVDFTMAAIKNCDMTVSDLSGSNFAGADLSGSSLAYALLPEASAFVGSIFEDVDFNKAIVPNMEWLQDVADVAAYIDSDKWIVQKFPNGVGDGWGDDSLQSVSSHKTSIPCFAIVLKISIP